MRRTVIALLITGFVGAFLVGPTPATDPTARAATVSSPMMNVAPYFWVDENGSESRPGPFLLPVQRKVEATPGVGRASLLELIAGPTKAEKNANPGISSQIPEGTELLDLIISDGTAKVYLNEAFAGDAPSAAAALTAAQVVFTLTRFSTVQRVIFFQDGEKIKVQTDDGELRYKARRSDYRAFEAAISVETPTYHGITKGSVRVTGEAAVFEAAFSYKLKDAAGNVLEKGIAMSDNGAGWGSFDFTIPYTVSERQVGQLSVWTFSAKDGARIDLRKYPVVLRP